MTSAGIDWADIRKKLPYERTEEQKKKRMDMFNQFDPNANGYLSLAETEKGIRDVLRCDALFANKRPIHRAFHLAKKVGPKGKSGKGDDYLEKREFRLFLQLLRQYFEYMQAFSRLDTGDDNRISKEEFTNPEVKSIVELWVGPIADMAAEFDTIDKNGGGQILFDEFVDWATAKNLDIEDDDD